MTVVRDRWQAMQPRERVIVLALGIVIAIAIVFFAFVSGGGGGPQGYKPPAGLSTIGVTPPSPSTTPLPETFEVFEGKDPFQPLITVVQGGGGSSAPPPSSSSGGGGSGPQPSTQPTPGQRVTLEDVFMSHGTRYATVSVNGTEYTVKKGDTFAGSYRVLDLTASCGTFVFGDERFTLCVGQEVLK